MVTCDQIELVVLEIIPQILATIAKQFFEGFGQCKQRRPAIKAKTGAVAIAQFASQGIVGLKEDHLATGCRQSGGRCHPGNSAPYNGNAGLNFAVPMGAPGLFGDRGHGLRRFEFPKLKGISNSLLDFTQKKHPIQITLGARVPDLLWTKRRTGPNQKRFILPFMLG